MNPLSFLAWLAGTIFGLACLAIVLGVVIDPYRMYGTAEAPGWTALKPRIYNQAEIAKTYQLERIAPATLLLGNSRVEIGLDPQSSRWPADAQPVFNAAMAGGNLRTALLMLRDAIALRPPHTVVLGLDFVDFLQQPDTLRPIEEPIGPDQRRVLVDRTGAPNPERPLQMWRDRVATTLTIDAVVDSVATLFDQNPEESSTITPLGFNPLHEYRLFAARQGYHALFEQKNAVYRKQYPRYPAADYLDPSSYASFRYLQAIMALTAARGCGLVLFIHPYHADYLDMLQQAGLWRSFENWKRALVKIVEAESGTRPAGVLFFDFSGYNEYTTEGVPPPGDRRTAMRWYWEAGHYKAALGDEMLRTVTGGSARFGSVLTSATVEHVLGDIQAARSRFTAKRKAAFVPAASSRAGW